MKNQKNILKLRIINTLFFIVLLYIQYNGIFSLKIATATPMLVLALLVTICMFCSEITAALSGLLLGIFVDTAASTPQGFNAVVFMILGLSSVLVIKHLFNNNLLSSVALCALCTTAYYLTRWIFSFAFSLSFAENLKYIMQTIFPSVLYTALFAVPFYLVQKRLYSKYYN